MDSLSAIISNSICLMPHCQFW